MVEAAILPVEMLRSRSFAPGIPELSAFQAEPAISPLWASTAWVGASGVAGGAGTACADARRPVTAIRPIAAASISVLFDLIAGQRLRRASPAGARSLSGSEKPVDSA